MKQTDPQMRLRLPTNVKSWIELEAQKNLRSLNAEVVAALKEKIAATGNEIGVLAPAAAEDHNTRKECCDAAGT